jgi:hypothetical protein
MSIADYIVDVQSGSSLLNSIEEGFLGITINENSHVLNIENSHIQNLDNIEIQKFNDYDLILTNTVYANLPDEIPMSIISGNLHVSRIDGLDTYLSTIPIDGGTP